ncbi:hypothetical protein M5K25_000102 [Dendrobium thyrsiflorum]|uniref:Uncharacterized protein n=1 Tax=Dendrobium thyrsiflorum TaxID=117978 RepID=A0ABD0VT08_DENTH
MQASCSCRDLLPAILFCVRLVSELQSSRMTDKCKGLATDEDRSIESLWANQANILRQLESLSTDVQRLSLAVHREFNLHRTRVPLQQPRRDQQTTLERQDGRGGRPANQADDEK